MIPGKIYLNAEAIESLNRQLGNRISGDYEGLLAKGEELLVIITLKGALLFAADLIRQLRVPVSLDFVRLASYGAGTKSSGQVRFVKDIETSVQGRHVLVLDEIVDTGRTLDFLRKRLEADSPKSVRIAALLSKPSRREIPVHVDYIGRDVEDKFLVGYGLDHNEKYRQLRDIYALD